jgi:nucleoside-diphosphate-sugar epimerase
MEQGLPLSIVMPGLVYGPGDTSGMHGARRSAPAALADDAGQTAFCWAHVEDTARAHILTMERGKPGETYIIAGPRHVRIRIRSGRVARQRSRAGLHRPTRCVRWRQ